MGRTKLKNKAKKPSITMDAPYWKGFTDGQAHERKVCIRYFITKMEELKKVEGVGEKTFLKIMDFVNKNW